MVVNGNAPTFGCAAVSAASSVDLPAFGAPDQADVGDQLQLELDPALLARRPLLVMGWGPMGGRHEVHVAASAAAAAGDDQPLSGRHQLAEHPAGLIASCRLRPTRTTVPGGTGSSTPGAVAAVGSPPRTLAAGLGAEMPVAVIVAEGGHPGIDDQHDVAAVAAIPAVGATAGNVRLAAKRGGTVAAGTGGNEDPHLVSEHRQPMIPTVGWTARSALGERRGVPTGSEAG